MSETKKVSNNKSDYEKLNNDDSSNESNCSNSSENLKKKKEMKSKHSRNRRSSSSIEESTSQSDKKYSKEEKSKNNVEYKLHSKHSHNKKNESSTSNNWSPSEEYSGRSKWDSPNMEFDRQRDSRNQSFSKYDKNKDRDLNYSESRRNDLIRSKRSDGDRHDDRDRYNKYEESNRNYERRNSPKRKDQHRNFRNRRSEERKSYNKNDSNYRYTERKEKQKRRSRSGSPRRPRKYPRNRNEDKTYEWGKREDNEKDNDKNEVLEKEKPNFALSGKLTEDTNKVNGIVIKYSEPPEARKPKRRWRLYPFKGEKALPTLYIHRQSCYLIGRDRKVCDLPVDHPSCSKQHAALQYRLVPFEREDGSTGKRVRPYLIDLESANGTFINNKPIEPRKYFELLEKDVIKFGFSSREYVLLHENSKEEDQDDDVPIEELQIKEEPTG